MAVVKYNIGYGNRYNKGVEFIMSNIHNSKFSKYYEDVKKYYLEGKTGKEIIQLLNSPDITKPRQIAKIANILGIRKRHPNNKIKEKFAEKDKKAMELISQGMSCTKTAKLLGVDQQSMNSRLKRFYNFTVLLDGKKKVDSHYFEVIDTEEKAYWLGFLYADGYIGKNNEVELCLCERDKQHVMKFKECLKSEHAVSRKIVLLNGKQFAAYRISIKDSELANGLIKHGCVNNKSDCIEMPQLNSKELYRHFVRGFVDGDGSIIHRRNYISVNITSASESFCNSLTAYCQEIVGINFVKQKYANENAYHVTTMARAEGILFLHHLYDNCNIYLDRKYNQYLKVCRLETISLKSLNDEDGIKRGWRNVD